MTASDKFDIGDTVCFRIAKKSIGVRDISGFVRKPAMLVNPEGAKEDYFLGVFVVGGKLLTDTVKSLRHRRMVLTEKFAERRPLKFIRNV